MDTKEVAPAPDPVPNVAYATSSVASHRRGERSRTYVWKPRSEARM